jgi:glycosyltransferase involved in cell wall biosynthesis
VNPRGYGRFTRELTLALLRSPSHHTFTLVVDSGAASAVRHVDGADVLVVNTGRAVVDAATATGSRSPVDMLRMSAALSRFDGVLFPTNYSFVPVLPGRFVSVVIHDAIPEAMPELALGSRRAQQLWRLKNRLACWQASLIATVSQTSAAEIRRLLPVGGRELLVLTEGAGSVFSPNAAVDEPDLVRTAVPRPGRFVLFVGGISPHKRVAELVRGFGAVCGNEGFDDLQLVLAGPDGRDQFAADQSGVAEAIRSLGPAADRVVKTGFVSDQVLAALYRNADCAVLPSMAEGFGLPALEAMSSGTPLIVSTNPALREVCGDAAEYVENIDHLDAAIQRILGDRARREDLRRRGLARARLFSWDEAARRLVAVFDRRDTPGR